MAIFFFLFLGGKEDVVGQTNVASLFRVFFGGEYEKEEGRTTGRAAVTLEEIE